MSLPSISLPSGRLLALAIVAGLLAASGAASVGSASSPLGSQAGVLHSGASAHGPGEAPPASSGDGSTGGAGTPSGGRLWIPPLPPTAHASPPVVVAGGPAPSPGTVGAPTTDINGSAHINGSLLSSQNFLSGTVHIVGQTTTSGYTQTEGWADYGPTVVTGSMAITPLAGASGPIFSTTGGSSMWVDGSTASPTALAVMQGDISIGNAGSGDAVQMDTTGGTILTIYANQAGSIASYPSGNTNLNAGSNIAIDNFANSTGSITVTGCTLVCPITVSPGTTFTPCYPIIGCISASTTSISWGANTYFQITGDTTTSGSGVTASLTDSRMVVTIPAGGNMSLTPAAGAPSLSVAPGPTLPALVATVGHSTVSSGESLASADTVVQGTFQAVQLEENGGTFYNNGGLDIVGHIDAAGEQIFHHDLQIQQSLSIRTYPGGNVTNTGTVYLGTATAIQGSSAAEGIVNITGILDQGPVMNNISGTVNIRGALQTRGIVSSAGSTLFQGDVASSGDILMPNAFLNGTFTLTAGSFTNVGTTYLSGSSSAVGNITVDSAGFTVLGTSDLTGTTQALGNVIVTGTSVIRTAPGAWFHLTSIVQMGVTSTGSWTAQVVGAVFTQGTSYSNGTATFTAREIAFPPSLTVHGTAWTEGNITTEGLTTFDGAVATVGTSHFPGTTLVGEFTLAAPGSVVSTGTCWVTGNVSLSGVLSIGVGTFGEVGDSLITGALDMDASVSLSGDAVIATGPSGALHMNSTIQMGAEAGTFTSQVVGSVMTQGTVYTNGTSNFTATTATFPPGLSVHGVVDAQGNVTVLGTTLFQGSVATSGTSRFPGASLQGAFTLAAGGSLTSVGTNWVEGNVSLDGLLAVGSSSFSETGSSSILGYADLAGPVTVNGDASVVTSSPGDFQMTGDILMGASATGATSQVVGTVTTLGVVFANGTSSFTDTEASFPAGLSVHGTVGTSGNISVHGGTDFTGAVTTEGLSVFPGMTLSGTFVLSAAGGSVNATGTSSVLGNITLQGILFVGSDSFQEVGSSIIQGTLRMTGTVVVNGDSTLTTSPGTLLEMSGNIQLASAAHIIGNVNATGGVTIAGSAVLSPSSVLINGSMSLTGWVTSRGIITLSGEADFLGPVLTQGHTSLPGLQVAGNYSLYWGQFRLDGTISLDGATVSQGSVVANSSGYFVVGTSRIDGTTAATGSAWVQGASTVYGNVDLNGGSQFGTYMVVNGDLDTGGLDLKGPLVLPDDTVTFSSPANITGSIWQNGLLTSSNGVADFVGSSIINGTVTSSGSPTVSGPVDLSVGGTYFVLTLSVPFYLLAGGLLALPAVGLIELGRLVRRRKHPLTELDRAAVRGLRPLAAGAGGVLLAGVGVGLGGSFYLGSVLSSPSGASSATSVVPLELVASALLLGGLLLWVVHRVLWRSRRSRAEREGGLPPRFEGYDPSLEPAALGPVPEAYAEYAGPVGALPEEGAAVYEETPAPGPLAPAASPGPPSPPTSVPTSPGVRPLWAPHDPHPWGQEELPPWARRPPPSDPSSSTTAPSQDP